MKKYRDIVNPITIRDWFLYYLYNDEEFCEVRKKWRTEINEINSGEPGRDGLPFAEQEAITDKYVDYLENEFNVTRDTARNGLIYDKWSNSFNRSRIPTSVIEKDRILISIGADTRLEDLEHYWKIWIVELQKKLPQKHGARDSVATKPKLAYAIYRELHKGRRMVDVHDDYLNNKLEADIVSGNEYMDINDFREYYSKSVKGFIKTF